MDAVGVTTLGRVDARGLIALGFAVRLALVLFSYVQDAYLKVKYTDIDYWVYSDAALHLLRGGSPFDRDTYRYTPLIAYLLTPNHVLFSAFGKLLFVNADIVISIIHLKLLRGKPLPKPAFVGVRTKRGLEWRLVGPGKYEWKRRVESTLHFALAVWLFNPYTATISSRGSSDSISSLCLMLMLLQLEGKKYLAAGFWFGLAAHIRLFPIIYVPPLLVHLGTQTRRHRTLFIPQKGLRSLVAVNAAKLAFAFAAALTCLGLCAVFYLSEGQRYLDEAVLYHFGRFDLAHNFSPWFFVFRVVTDDNWRRALGLAAFLPQVASCAYFGVLRKASLPYALFMVTLSFVTLNKVVTAQYFAWYLVLLPLIYPSLKMSARLVASAGLWVMAQLNWLAWAYLYEFEKMESVLFLVFLSSLLFVASNCYLMLQIDKSYSFS